MNKKTTPSPADGGKARSILIVCVLVIVMGLGYLLLRNPPEAPPPSPTPGMVSTNPPAAAPDTVRPAFQKLVGRWLREDGGYVIEISGVDPDGRLTAGYFNPRPIHVSQAAAVEEAGGSVKVGLELDDAGYPKCLYTLLFNPTLDQLQGTYYQAAQGETYEVVFVRLPVE
jgi:hypothetical protein